MIDSEMMPPGTLFGAYTPGDDIVLDGTQEALEWLVRAVEARESLTVRLAAPPDASPWPYDAFLSQLHVEKRPSGKVKVTRDSDKLSVTLSPGSTAYFTGVIRAVLAEYRAWKPGRVNPHAHIEPPYEGDDDDYVHPASEELVISVIV